MREKVKYYMQKIAKHSMKETKIGKVLDDILDMSGKMFRSQLLLLCASLGKRRKEKEEILYQLAALVELTHLASLIHDDIIDDAPYRRRKISMQAKYGKDVAVYAGDFLMARIYYYGAKEKLNTSATILCQATEAMCMGEIGQDLFRYREDMSIEQYFSNISGKTASLFEAACKIGAMEAQCSPTMIEILSCFGKNLGVMFQLKDDVLDFIANSETLGKQTMQDFQNGIYTFPVLYSLQQKKGRKELFPFLEENKKRSLSEEEMEEIKECVIASGGIEASYQEIKRLSKENKEILKNFDQNNEFVKSLYSMLLYLEG